MKNIKKWPSFLFVLILLVSFTACGAEKASSKEKAPKEIEAVKKDQSQEHETKEEVKEESKEEALNRENDEIVLASYRDMVPGEKDGYYCSWALYVWEPLVTQDIDGRPIPCLAESWEMSEDGKTWIFQLRKGVKFHDGSDFNANAVIANMDRIKPEVKKSRFYPLDIKSHYPGLVSYEKVNDYAVKYVFENPSPTQHYNMVNWGSAIYAPTNFDANRDFNGPAIGTGPFKISGHVPNQYATLERFEDYWGEKAKAKSIKVKAIPDSDTKFAALKSGEIMGVLDLKAISPSLANEIRDDAQFGLSTAKSTMIRFLIPNGTKFPFNDVRMKQAVSLILNREEIVEGVHYGFGVPTTNILNYSTPFYKEIPVKYDPEAAKKLAQEVLGDKKVTVDFLYNGKDPVLKTECELTATYLEALGIQVNLVPLEYSAMKERMKAGDFHLARAQQGLSNGEAATIFRRFMVTSGDHNKNYSLGYDSEKVNILMEKAAQTLNMEERKSYYDEIQMLSSEELPIIPLFNDKTVLAYNKEIKDYIAQLYGLELPKIHW